MYICMVKNVVGSCKPCIWFTSIFDVWSLITLHPYLQQLVSSTLVLYLSSRKIHVHYVSSALRVGVIKSNTIIMLIHLVWN